MKFGAPVEPVTFRNSETVDVIAEVLNNELGAADEPPSDSDGLEAAETVPATKGKPMPTAADFCVTVIIDQLLRIVGRSSFDRLTGSKCTPRGMPRSPSSSTGGLQRLSWPGPGAVWE